ncbi:putative reverse transcriptase domain-containing protein [Tanacetum coccineum]|uniref:Reverse transcriptase domain-containing protein n=1 Tax=Tanacetum coccineum TaxID=301880 RepID=A0ABQ5AD07_9ASTR
MLRACIIDFGGNWDDHLPLVEFAYNNSYHASIKMPPYEMLYGRRCRTPICWDEVGSRELASKNVVLVITEKIETIRERLKEARDRWKSYADKRRRLIEFNVGDFVILKFSPWKGWLADESSVITLDDVEINPELTSQEEPVAILGRKSRQLRNKEIPLVKVEWKHRKGTSISELYSQGSAEMLYLGSNTTYSINEYGVFGFQSRYGHFDTVYQSLSLIRHIQLMNTAYSSSELIRRAFHIKSEIDSILQNHTWELVDLLSGCKPLGYKWIFKKNMKADGTIDKYKARLVIKGFRQREGLDFFDTYFPVTQITSIRMVLAIAVIRKLEVHQMDVKMTFLNKDLEKVLCMNQPEGFMAPGLESKVCRLVKILYGLRKAPKQGHQFSPYHVRI